MARKAHAPTESTRELVRLLAGYGVPHDEIALRLGIAPKTLRKHYGYDLAFGASEANQAVIRHLHRLASTSRNPASAIFWAKTRLGWRERDPAQAQSAPTQIVLKGSDKPARLLGSRGTDTKTGTDDE